MESSSDESAFVQRVKRPLVVEGHDPGGPPPRNARTRARCLLPLGMAATIGLGCGRPPIDGDEPLPPDMVVSATETALSLPSLTKDEEARVLDLVDDICGDTWCEGDDDFAFRSLACDSRCGTCWLRFQTFPREGSPAPRVWHSCKTTGFSGFDSLVVTAPNGYQSLAPSYYDALTTCISDLEARRR